MHFLPPMAGDGGSHNMSGPAPDTDRKTLLPARAIRVAAAAVIVGAMLLLIAAGICPVP